MKQCNGEEESGLFRVVDLYGRVLVRQLLNSRTNTLTINLEKFTAGIYFYKTIINNVAASRNKFVVIR